MSGSVRAQKNPFAQHQMLGVCVCREELELAQPFTTSPSRLACTSRHSSPSCHGAKCIWKHFQLAGSRCGLFAKAGTAQFSHGKETWRLVSRRSLLLLSHHLPSHFGVTLILPSVLIDADNVQVPPTVADPRARLLPSQLPFAKFSIPCCCIRGSTMRFSQRWMFSSFEPSSDVSRLEKPNGSTRQRIPPEGSTLFS